MNNVHWGIWPFHSFCRVITHGDFIFIVSSCHRVIASSSHRLIVSSSLQPMFLDEEQDKNHRNNQTDGNHIEKSEWGISHREPHIHAVKS